ncbi:MAG: hypothetical protein HY717_13810 [Planctomycetes bacterium]|nr:hypothetical protein [Planctomycetota bacterium]
MRKNRSRFASYHILSALTLLLALLPGPVALARACRVNLVPNGRKFMCLTCHVGSSGGVRNLFGDAVSLIIGGSSSCSLQFWGPALATEDSDGDGLANGEELGDPAGAWKPGDPSPGDPALVTPPGVAETLSKPEVSSVDPKEVSTLGGTAIRVSGANFQASTVIRIGALLLESRNLVDAALITGVAPALSPDETPGPRDLTASDERGNSILAGAVIYVVPPNGMNDFVRGDFNSDGSVDLSDAVGLLLFLFTGGGPPACLDAADADDSGKVDISDAVFILAFRFLGGARIPSPYPMAGPDLSPDDLPCGGPGSGSISEFRAGPASIDLPAVGTVAQVEVTAFVDGVQTDLHLAAQGTTYESSNRAVAAVYRDGLVEARGTGAATIAVRHGDLEAAVAVRVTAAGGSPAVKVLASSELGLHFLDREFSVFSFHPPSSSLRAQVVRSEAAGKVAILDESQVEMRYSPMVDARGSENSTSVRKTDFWKAAPASYGRPFEAGQGLLGLFMPDDGPRAGSPTAGARRAGRLVAGRRNPHPRYR